MRASRANIDVGGVLAAGRELDLHEAVVIPDFGSSTFPAPADVALAVRRVARGLAIVGTVAVTAQGACARCLDDVRLPLRLDVNERIESDARYDPFGENNILTGDELDLGDLVRQLIDSALPIALLCSDDCKGLCPNCGRKRDDACRCPDGDPK